ncbi:MAG: prepilin-type N-terminal cleavage/methylation domain-containing protein [Gammaproteobacteria bacterium]|nr:prepilin-type N-terminal cleavage/methylation domain-containing protein [Gammaproteobacteria bacterium]
MKIKQQGFTLIELVVVITILGILAAFALPRFAGLEIEARKATVDGLAGSVRSAAALAHSLQLAQAGTTGASVTMEGQVITMVNRYPTSNAAGIEAALQDITGFTGVDNAGDWEIQKDGANDPTQCNVLYAAAGVGASPTITPDKSDC